MSFLSDTVGAFETGSLFMTSTVFAATCEHLPFASFVRIALSRHQAGDWGDDLVLCKSNEAIRNGFISEELQPTGLQQQLDGFYENDIALQGGGRLFSVYHLPQGIVLPDSKIWIITEVTDRCFL
jgi:hypothetical protein